MTKLRKTNQIPIPYMSGGLISPSWQEFHYSAIIPIERGTRRHPPLPKILTICTITTLPLCIIRWSMPLLNSIPINFLWLSVGTSRLGPFSFVIGIPVIHDVSTSKGCGRLRWTFSGWQLEDTMSCVLRRERRLGEVGLVNETAQNTTKQSTICNNQKLTYH